MAEEKVRIMCFEKHSPLSALLANRRGTSAVIVLLLHQSKTPAGVCISLLKVVPFTRRAHGNLPSSWVRASADPILLLLFEINPFSLRGSFGSWLCDS